MHPKDEPNSKETHNWVDWFLHSEYTFMRVYGAKVAPHCLHLYVSKRLDFMELMWKIDFMDYAIFKKPRKGIVVHPQCDFSYFKVTTPEGYQRLGIMVSNLRMPINEIRNFDPKGFVERRRRQKNLGVICHEFLCKDDVLRNLTSNEAFMTRKKDWIAIMNIEDKIMKKNSFYVSPYNEIANPLERAFTMLRDY